MYTHCLVSFLRVLQTTIGYAIRKIFENKRKIYILFCLQLQKAIKRWITEKEKYIQNY